ncbi:MAG TPA: flagellar biosynthesis protein FlgF, partial [Succinivibrionaceae bacterium]|nr:flagellar biosynthesis protein FlgF [Succinivibrionaceae bacterium]
GADGVLRTQSGLDVLDENGSQIILPPLLEAVHISDDGVISGRPQGADSNVIENYQRIKLVKSDDYKNIEKGYDGLFRQRDGTSLAQDESVKVRSGMLEASNVNPVEELTSLIRIQRQYDTTVKLIDEANQMDQAQDRLLSYQ